MSIHFLMCSERSGSNLITRQLNGHRDICGPATKHLLNPVARNLFRYGDLRDERDWRELLTDVHRLLSAKFSIWKKEFTLQELTGLAQVGDVGSLVRNIFIEEAHINDKKHVFVKENQVYEFFPFLLTHFPDAKYIYQTRDPRDMALSWKKNADHPGGVVTAARQWKQDQQKSLMNYHLLESQGKAHFVRYEDLIENNVVEIEKILRFLEVSDDEGVFTFYEDELTQKNAALLRAWNNLARGVISENSLKYRNELSEPEIKAIEAVCQYEMKHLGYTTEFSAAELAGVSQEWIDDFNRKEVEVVKLVRAKGVQENMVAKQQFYRR